MCKVSISAVITLGVCLVNRIAKKRLHSSCLCFSFQTEQLDCGVLRTSKKRNTSK